MRHKILVTVLACMLLCGCDGGKDTSETKSHAGTSSTTVSISAEPQTTEISMEKATAITTSQSAIETTTITTSQVTAETAVKNNNTAEVTEAEPSRTQAANESAQEDEAVADFGEEVANAPKVTTIAETTETQTIPNGGDFSDDGMVWTPLVPVDLSAGNFLLTLLLGVLLVQCLVIKVYTLYHTV